MIASMFMAMAVATTPIGQFSSLTYTSTHGAGIDSPGRLAPAGGGGIYVAEPAANAVVELDAAGAVINTFPVPEGPLAVAVHPSNGQIYISRRDGVVGVYDSLFVYLGVDLTVPLPVVMGAPGDIEIHPGTGEIYVADTGQNQLVVFDAADTFVRAWGMTGPMLAEFNAPQSIAIDPVNDRVIVTDIDNFRAQVFDTAGLFQYRFGYRILFAPLFQAAWFARGGGVDVDACGNLYIADTLMGTLRTFSGAGVELAPGFVPVVGYGTNPGELKNPSDVMIDGGKLYIANAGNGAVEVFDVACSAPARAPAALATRGSVTRNENLRTRKQATKRVRGPDNPSTIVETMNAGKYDYKLDINSDRTVDINDLTLAVERFGAATVDDFLNPTGVTAMTAGARTIFEQPHIVDIPDQCGRCHSMDGLPGGMLSADGQENLCHSCHTGAGLAKHTPIDAWMNGNSHPWGVAADSGDVEGPDPNNNSEMAFHLDNGDIRCSTCHNQHSQEQGQPYLRASIDNVQLCTECHQELGAQWRVAGHSQQDAGAFVHYDWTQPNRAACRKCHSGNGYVDFSNDVAQADRNGAFRVHDCLVCHAAHGKPQDEHMLRIYGEVALPAAGGGEEVVTGVGGMATCMACHNGRRAPDGGLTPHYLLGGVMLEGINGNEFGASIPSSPHGTLTDCMACHMADSPQPGQPGANKVGEHTFNMKVHDAADPDYGFENFENACNAAACHGDTGALTTFNRLAYGDYDGDATVEGVQDETQGLLDLVFAEIGAAGAVFLGYYPYWDLSGVDPLELDAVQDAIWNFEFVDNSGSLGVHNTSYAVGLLQVTYKALTGADIAGAFLRYDAGSFALSNTHVEITSVNGGAPVEAGGALVVNFTIEDDDGLPIDILDLNRLGLRGVSGPAYNYQRVIANDSDLTHFVQNPDGSYTYTAVDPFPSVYMAPENDSAAYGIADGEMTGQALLEGTYTVRIEARRSFGSIRKADDATADFVVANDPLLPPAIAPREFVLRDRCNACHLDLQMHGGGRFEVTGCVLCHTAGAEDRITDPATTAGVNVMFKDMIHKIHAGNDLPTVAASASGADPYRYQIIGYGDRMHDFSDVGFPRMPGGVAECDACHGGAAQEAEILTNITRTNCATCHNDINFVTGTILDRSNPAVDDGLLTAAQLSDPAYRVFPGKDLFPPDGISHVFVDDTGCAACHGAGMIADAGVAHLNAISPAKEGTGLAIEIVDVGGMTGGGGLYFVAGDYPEVTFKLTDSSGPVELVEGDSTVVDRVCFVVTGPTTLYQHVIPGEDQSRVRAWYSGSLNVDNLANWTDNFAVDGTYTYVFEPAGASSRSDSWPAVYPAAYRSLPDQFFPFEEGWGQLYTAGGAPLDDGTYTVTAWARRVMPISGAREPAAANTFDVLYGANGPIVPYAGTVDDNKCNACHGQLAFHGSGRRGVRACMACHTPGMGDENVDLRVLIHKVHNGANLTQPYIEDIDHMLLPSMPGGPAECEVCHSNDAWKTPPVRSDMRTMMVACTSCHDSPETLAHVEAGTVAGTFTETCVSCHGPGAAWAIDKVHGTP